MKHLIQLITEGDIDRIERKYREFCRLCKVYDPTIDMKDVCVHKTSKNNWAVYVKKGDDCKKLFVASYLVLDDDVIKRNDIEVCNESLLNEARETYEMMFLQYDPDVQQEFEDGDATEDDLHDSAYEDEKVKRFKFTASNEKDAVRKATKELAKVVNKYPEVCAASIYYDSADDGEILQTIFI